MEKFDLKIKKPDWKRTDVLEVGEETESDPVEAVPETESSSKRRSSPVRVTGALVLGAVGLLALSRFRRRRRDRRQDVFEQAE